MQPPSLTHAGEETRKFLLSILLISLGVTTWSDQPSLVPVPPAYQEVEWTLGPATVSLGGVGKIAIPDGYRYTGGKAAQMLMYRMRNPVPQNLIGILAPNEGASWIVLTYADVGYVKGLGPAFRLDGDAILQTVRAQLPSQNAGRARAGLPPITSATWAVPPEFDSSRCMLEWALIAETQTEKMVDLQAETVTDKAINHTIILVGRRGLLNATAVQSDQQAPGAISLKQLVQNISFNPGERYADYKAGDPIAKVRLQELIAGEKPATPLSVYALAGIWAGGVLLAGGIMAAGWLLIRRKLRQHRASRAFPDYQEHGHALAHVLSASENGAASKTASSHRNGMRRKREFDYQKYYSSMMREVSGGSYSSAPPFNGKYVARIPNGQPGPAPSAPGHNMVVNAHSELIANQVHLIEEQKRLLQEQSRLIEEKSRLIQEKNQLLRKQAELLERDLL